MPKDKTIIRCPTCGKEVVWGPESRWRPFCSERCRLIDLGEWINEKHRIPDQDDSAPPPAHPADEE
ncbi:MAG TPA: DNA gyrase inhibitor YacG [Chromatiales bacterium]|nr:DNA gyrase inhibitor YacG [Chromatiales bacterium]